MFFQGLGQRGHLKLELIQTCKLQPKDPERSKVKVTSAAKSNLVCCKMQMMFPQVDHSTGEDTQKGNSVNATA